MPASVTVTNVNPERMHPQLKKRLSSFPDDCSIVILPRSLRKNGDLLGLYTEEIAQLLHQKGVKVYIAANEGAVEEQTREAEIILPVLLFLAKSTASFMIEEIARWLYNKFIRQNRNPYITFEHYTRSENNNSWERQVTTGTASEVAEALLK